ncbi:MAG: hypothetical protein GYA33_06095, partial [Thermogutta sp.]|nr:hypothetical protein [Thermogutta sp.]
LLEAEDVLRSSPAGSRGIVLRSAGIYGPGRIPLLANLRAGLPLTGASEAVINLIHVDDTVTAILLATGKAARPNLFNVSDGHPATRAVFYSELARLLSLPAPKFGYPSQRRESEDFEGTSGTATARGTGRKRVSNDKICRELGFSCRYPSYKEGLLSIVREGLAEEASRDRV